MACDTIIYQFTRHSPLPIQGIGILLLLPISDSHEKDIMTFLCCHARLILAEEFM